MRLHELRQVLQFDHSYHSSVLKNVSPIILQNIVSFLVYMFLPCDLGIHVYIQDINIYIYNIHTRQRFTMYLCVYSNFVTFLFLSQILIFSNFIWIGFQIFHLFFFQGVLFFILASLPSFFLFIFILFMLSID